MNTKRETIREIIVVEGKDDTVAIKRAVNADTIETNGSAINQEIINRIKRAQQVRGVIIFTDPDYPGEKIRQTIDQSVPNCIHAFLSRKSAIPKNGKGIGIEHATPADIRKALRCAHSTTERPVEWITKQELFALGITGGPGAREIREKLGTKLRIGYANSKQFHKRLIAFGITKEEFQAACTEIFEQDLQSNESK